MTLSSTLILAVVAAIVLVKLALFAFIVGLAAKKLMPRYQLPQPLTAKQRITIGRSNKWG